MHFLKVSTLVASIASVASAESWGTFSGQVKAVERLSGDDYALVSELTIKLNDGWSFNSLNGRTEGQISNQSIVFSEANKNYVGEIGYTNTASNDTETAVCFPAVPIQIQLDQESGEKNINGNFNIGCIDKSEIKNYNSAASASSAGPASTLATVTPPVANHTSNATGTALPTVPQANSASLKSISAIGAIVAAIAMFA